MEVIMLQGKTGIITGVVNDKSIAWAIAEMAAKMGAKLYFMYQSEMLEKRVRPLVESLGFKDNLIVCDVTNDESLQNAYNTISAKADKIDFVLHAIAFSDKNELRGRYLDTTKSNFLNTMDVSCYSLLALTKTFEPLMKDGCSIVTLSYYGAEKAIPNYNVMGVAKAALEASVRYLAADLGPKNIRVNAISAGPIKTLAAAGIAGFRGMLSESEKINPLRRTTSQEDVAGAATFLVSDLSKAITGDVIYVDCGFHAVGMAAASEE